MPYSDQHLSLGIRVLDLLHADYFLFIEHFNSVESTVVFRSNKVDTSK